MSEPTSPAPEQGTWRVLAVAAAVVFVVTVLRFGWMSDDAFISFRAAANLVHGHGLLSNPPERVQAFTNPLWTLAVSLPYALFGNIYWSAMLLSLACTVALAVLLVRRLPPVTATLCLVLLMASKSFVTFETSGLENTLSHLLLGAFFLDCSKPREKRLWVPWLLAGLLAFNRIDHAVLVAPALVASLRRHGIKPSLKPALIGLSPILVWLLFATLYYGFPWPNTAYAKLNTAIARRELWLQGVSYLVDAALRDGVLAVIIAATFALVPPARKRLPGSVPALLGVAAYLLYIAWIGGDFMGGRFLTAPLLVSALYASAALAELPQPFVAATAAALLLWGRAALEPLPVDPRTECVVVPSGIVDERACYVEHTGIAQNFRARKYEKHQYFTTGVQMRESGKRVTSSTLVGLAGFAAGPNVQIVDEYGLTDPLTARVRFRPAGEWRIGHFPRGIPRGYLASLESGENKLEDACLRGLYDDLRLVTRGRLFDGARLRAMWRLNFVRGGCRAP